MAKPKAKKEEPKSIEVTQEILDLNPALVEGGVSIGDEIEITPELVLDAPEAPKQPKGKKAGVKYAVYLERGEGKREYIRTYEDEAPAKEFAGKVAQRVVVEE